MAKAIRKTKEIVRTIKEKVDDGVTLELTKEEAKLLYVILGASVTSIGYQIYNALNDVLPHTWLTAGPLQDDRKDILDYING